MSRRWAESRRLSETWADLFDLSPEAADVVAAIALANADDLEDAALALRVLTEAAADSGRDGCGPTHAEVAERLSELRMQAAGETNG